MNILFVCTGNTCRSCMAEAIFNNKYKEDDIIASSAGVYAIEGSKASLNSVNILKKNINIDISHRYARQLNLDILEDADLVLTMTNSIRDLLQNKFPYMKDKIHSLSQYVGDYKDVIDPFGGDESVYNDTYNQLDSLINLLIDKLKEDRSIY